jgi:hypothetical protein
VDRLSVLAPEIGELMGYPDLDIGRLNPFFRRRY